MPRVAKIGCVLPLLAVVAADRRVVGAEPADTPATVAATLNGLSVVLDARTGGILQLAYPGLGTLLDTESRQAGLIELAYPIPTFEPLRLASRYARDARITKHNGAITVRWERLGASRPFDLPGGVSATVELKAASDGRSVILLCKIENRSDHAVRQVLFPDLAGLLPFAGEDDTEFRTAGTAIRPFRSLVIPDRDEFYATDLTFTKLKGGGLVDSMILRWMDLGSLRGGFSLFARRWGWDPRTTVMLRRSEASGKLRLMCAHPVTIAPGATWTSGEFWLTPHTSGWAKGIEPYRKWARQHMHRAIPVPEHVRNGLGFRSVWMCQNQPNDPRDAIWKFRDLVPLAREAKEHGLDEMVVWAWHRGFALPFPPPYSHLGTEAELVRAVRDCKQLGVNVALFVSVLQADKTTAARYGLTIQPGSGNWTYHTELIPRFNPDYASNFRCAQADTTNPRWQADALASCRRLVDRGLTSICWDQYWSVPEQPNVNTLSAQIRAEARRHDPGSTFSGEELRNMEVDCRDLDYTWNWGNERKSLQALVNVVRTPRINLNIDRSPASVKQGFADNLYLNVWPRKPDSINGSDWIANHPQVSSAVKQCAALRARFLPYFTDGIFIGDCILTKPCPGAHVSAYVLPDKLLTILINTGDAQRLSLTCDLKPWLASPQDRYTVTSYDGRGRPGATTTRTGTWQTLPRSMKPLEIALFEVLPK